ncbi:hypothetical protein ACFLUR_01150 [Chloroflexota bacterium]
MKAYIGVATNRIEDEYKTMDKRIDYLKSLLIKGKWHHLWIGWGDIGMIY